MSEDVWEYLIISKNIQIFQFYLYEDIKKINDIYVKKNEISYRVEIEEKGEKAKMADIS